MFGNGKTAIRGGFGMFPGRIPDDQTATHIVQPPLFSNRTYIYTTIRDSDISAGSASARHTTFSASSTSTMLPNDVQHELRHPAGHRLQHRAGRGVCRLASAGTCSRQRSFNSIPYGTTFQPSSIDPTIGHDPLPLNFLRPIQGYGDINYNELSSNSSYHSMQTTVEPPLLAAA